MSGDVAMNQASTTVLDHHEHVQQPERGGDGNEIVAGNDSLGVKAQERRPAQVASRSPWWTSDSTCLPSADIVEFPTSRELIGNALLAPRGFSRAIRRIKAVNLKRNRRSAGSDFNRQNNLHPARCQRIIVSGRTTTRASGQLKNRESNAREIRVTGSIRRGLIPALC